MPKRPNKAAILAVARMKAKVRIETQASAARLKKIQRAYRKTKPK